MACSAAPGMFQLPGVPWTPVCTLPTKACVVFFSLPSLHCPGLPPRNSELSPHSSFQSQACLDSLLQQALLGLEILGGVALLRRPAPRTTDFAEAYRRVQERDRGVHPLPVILAGCSPSSCLTVQGPLWSPPAQGATSPSSPSSLSPSAGLSNSLAPTS